MAERQKAQLKLYGPSTSSTAASRKSSTQASRRSSHTKTPVRASLRSKFRQKGHLVTTLKRGLSSKWRKLTPETVVHQAIEDRMQPKRTRSDSHEQYLAEAQAHVEITKRKELSICQQFRVRLTTVLDPGCWFCQRLNLLILVGIMWTCIVVPCRIGFLSNPGTVTGTIDYCFEILFILDVCLNFR
jgi:hypothetical protein